MTETVTCDREAESRCPRTGSSFFPARTASSGPERRIVSRGRGPGPRPRRSPPMSLQDAFEGILLLVTIAIAGRILLSLLPPGLPGYHEPANLPAPWPPRHLLG